MSDMKDCMSRFRGAILESLDDDKRITMGLVDGLIKYVNTAMLAKPIPPAPTPLIRIVPQIEYVLVGRNAPIPKKADKKKRRNIANWSTIKSDIRRRDESRCRICQADYYLHVHHIDHNRDNNHHSNLVTLCESCHQAVHSENYKPSDHEDYPTPWGEHPE